MSLENPESSSVSEHASLEGHYCGSTEERRHDETRSLPSQGSLLSDRRPSSPRSQGSNQRADDEGRPPETLNINDQRYCPSDSGYHSGASLSDGMQIISTTHAPSAVSSMRSVGSVGSTGSYPEREREQQHRHSSTWHGNITSQHQRGPPGRVMISSTNIINGETNFPTATSYAASEAAKSDVATVCSGSVIEDIDVASVMSGDTNIPSTPNNLLSSAPSSVTLGGGFRRSSSGLGSSSINFGDRRAVDFSQGSGLIATAAATTAAVQYQKSLVVDEKSNTSCTTLEQTNRETITTIAALNDMGPPLSRLGSSAPATDGSVVAHVDTDDCGGSLVESVADAHSVNSQDATPHSKAVMQTIASDDDKKQPVIESKQTEENPTLQNGIRTKEVNNGYISPGGTVYRGKGVRRYQGRYMNLPLKRFHQNACSIGLEEGAIDHRDRYENHCYDRDRSSRSRSRSRSRSASPNPQRNGRYNRRRAWSPSDNQDRSCSRSPPYEYDNSSRIPSKDRCESSYRKHQQNGRYQSRRNGYHCQHTEGRRVGRSGTERNFRKNGRYSNGKNDSNRSGQTRSQSYNRKRNENGKR